MFARSPEARNYLRMLVVIAAPVAADDGATTPLSPPLDVWGEWERLRGAVLEANDPVAGAPRPGPWCAWPSRRRSGCAMRWRLDPGYHAVHFICHGSPDGLRLEDSLGCEQFLPTAGLVAILAGDGLPARARIGRASTPARRKPWRRRW